MESNQDDATQFTFYFRQNRFREGYQYFLEKAKRSSIAIFGRRFSFGEKRKAYLSALIYQCRFALILGEWQEARSGIEKFHSSYHSLFGKFPELEAEIWHNEGEVHFYISEYDKATEYVDKAIALKNKVDYSSPRAKAITAGQSLVVKGKAYWKKGDFFEALRCYYQAISRYYSHYSDSDRHLIGRVMCLIGQVYMDLGDAKREKARLFLEKSREILSEALPPGHLYLGAVYNELGKYYMNQDASYGQARHYFNKAKASLENIYHERSHRYMASVLGNMADLFIKEQRDKVEQGSLTTEEYIRGALKKLSRELEVRVSSFDGQPHSSVARVYNKISGYHRTLGQHREAASAAHKALLAAISDYKDNDARNYPDISQAGKANSRSMVLHALRVKGEAYLQLAVQEAKESEGHLRNAYQAVNLATKVIEYIRGDFHSNESWLAFGKEARAIYELAIEVLMALRLEAFENNNARERAECDEQILEIFQKSKAALLLETIQKPGKRNGLFWNTNARGEEFDILKEVEIWLLSDQASGFDPNKFKTLNNFLEKEKKAKQKHLKEKEHLAEYVEKGREDTVEKSPVLNLQNLFREFNEGEDGMILSYFVGKRNMYVLLISGSTGDFDIQLLPYSEWVRGQVHLQRLIGELLDVLDTYDGDNTGIGQQEHPRQLQNLQFIGAVNCLYRSLIEPLLPRLESCKRLYIIPDDALSLLPFELLAPKPNDNFVFNYQELEYLIRKYKISYHASISILFNNHCKYKEREWRQYWKGRPGENGTPSPGPFQLLSVAAGVKQNKQFRNRTNRIIEEGVVNVAGILGVVGTKHRLFMRDEVKKRNSIINAMRHSEVLHFFGHSTIDDMAEETPALVLLDELDRAGRKVNRHLLTQKEICSLELFAELVILNTCRGGWGKITTGEGPMALTRAFLMAGGRNIYFTFFKIKGAFAKEMVENFVEKAWLEGQDYVTAMQEIKLAMIKRKKTAHPACWAAPAFIGNQLGKLAVLRGGTGIT